MTSKSAGTVRLVTRMLGQGLSSRAANGLCDSGCKLSRGVKRRLSGEWIYPQAGRVVPWGEARILWG